MGAGSCARPRPQDDGSGQSSGSTPPAAPVTPPDRGVRSPQGVAGPRVVGRVRQMPDTDRTAVLFPGQGSQTDDMRDMAEDVRPDLVALARDVVGEDPFDRVDDATRFQQPAIFCASVAGFDMLDVTPAAAAGHSLGEFGALAAAGAIDVEDALRLVALRGSVMDAAAQEAPPGGMLAVLKGKPGQAETIARAADVVVANDNAPGQVVLSGPVDALDAAAAAAEREGLRAMRLPVSGSFHSPAMEPAMDKLRAALSGPVVDLRAPVRTRAPRASARAHAPGALAPDAARPARRRHRSLRRDWARQGRHGAGPPHAVRRGGLRSRAGGRPCLSATPPSARSRPRCRRRPSPTGRS